MPRQKALRLKKTEILVLRSCLEDGGSRKGFKWPLEVGATVTAPDWEDTDECGHGLHGLPWGEGGAWCDLDAPVWLVLRVDTAQDYRHGSGELKDKCKFRSCKIVGVFDNSKDATDMIREYAPAGAVINYSHNSGGHNSHNSGGYASHNSGGNASHNSGGSCSHNSGGSCSHNSGGNASHNSGGHYSHNSGGSDSHNSGGGWSHNSGGHYSHNSGGDYSHNSGGYDSRNSGGDYSRCDGRLDSYALLGERACAALSWWDGKCERITVLYSGEDGIEPGKWYRLDRKGKPEAVPEGEWDKWMQEQAKKVEG